MVNNNIQWRNFIKGFLVVFCITFFSTAALSQEVFENAPPDMRWHQINTPHFRIIFPEDYEEKAQYVANKLEQIYFPASEALDAPPRKISIILQNRNASSNGFVSISPRRSELYTMPSQDYNFIGTNDWLDLLITHEFRHIVQYQQSLTGWNKFFYFLFGQNAQAGFSNISVPNWFWEGDATLTETLLTPSGRGSIPDFNRVYRTNLLEGNDFKYVKQHLGSYKDNVPNHYVLGYHFTTYLRRKTNDPKIWEEVTEDAFSWPFIPFTFSNSLKRNTGYNLRQNYRMMQDDLKKFWQEQQEILSPIEYDYHLRVPKVFTNYSFPQLLDGGGLVVQKEGLGDAAQFIVLENGEEKDVYIPGILNDAGYLSAEGNKIVWNEIFPDIRWRKESSSVIKSYDFETKKLNVVTRNSRYAGAALSPDGKYIVTSLVTRQQENFLVVLDALTGEEVKRLSSGENDFLSMARFSSDGSSVVSLLNRDGQKGVVKFDLNSGEMEFIIPLQKDNIGHPVLENNYLFYNSPYNGIDNIYALELSTGNYYQLTNSRYGAYNPEIDNQNGIIYFNDFTPQGMNISSIPFDPDSWKVREKVPIADKTYSEPLLEQESIASLGEMPEEEYTVSRYRSLFHIFNLHSWGPIATSDLTTAQLAIYSDDILRTTGITAGYEYNLNDESGVWFADISYQGLFPIFDFRVEKGDRSSNRIFNGQLFDFTWEETTTQAGIRFPLDLTRSKFFSELSAGYNIGVRNIDDFENSLFTEDNPNRLNIDRIAPLYDAEVLGEVYDIAFLYTSEISDGTLTFDNIDLNYYLLQKQSIRDVNSRWGLILDYELYNTRDFLNNDFNGSLRALRSTFYLPSPAFLINNNVMKHHSLYVRWNQQKRDNTFSPNLYFFGNRIFFPRGYSYPAFEEFSSYSINYKLPLFYPDINVGPFLYVKRAKLNMFYDRGHGNGEEYYILYEESPDNDFGYFSRKFQRNYRSLGAELTFDINVMRFPADIDLGVRWIYTLDPQTSQFEFILLNIDF